MHECIPDQLINMDLLKGQDSHVNGGHFHTCAIIIGQFCGMQCIKK